MPRTAARRLRSAGERVTPQRLVVAAALVRAARQVTAQELYDELRESVPGLGRATVFRTLDALAAAGVARRLELENHVYGYVACEPEHHHHAACTRCGRVVEIGEEFVRPVAERLASRLGFQVDDARLDFYGRCAECAGGRVPQAPAATGSARRPSRGASVAEDSA